MNNPQQASICSKLADLKAKSEAAARKPRKPAFWEVPNAPVWVTLRGITYAAWVIEHQHLGDFDGEWCKLRLSKTFPLWDGTYTTKTWIHPEPVQSYKLRKRVE